MDTGTSSVITWAVVGMLAGLLGARFMSAPRYGAEGHVVLGVLGATVAGFVVEVGFPGQSGPLITVLAAVAGAVVLIRVAGMLLSRRPA